MIADTLAHTFPHRLPQPPRPPMPSFEPLTPRELEVLQWVSSGKSNAEISMVLGISVCTVRVHIQSIFNKLPANNRTHAAARGAQLGLIDFGAPLHT